MIIHDDDNNDNDNDTFNIGAAEGLLNAPSVRGVRLRKSLINTVTKNQLEGILTDQQGVLKRRQSAGNSPSIARALPIVPPPGTSPLLLLSVPHPSQPHRPINYFDISISLHTYIHVFFF